MAAYGARMFFWGITHRAAMAAFVCAIIVALCAWGTMP